MSVSKLHEGNSRWLGGMKSENGEVSNTGTLLYRTAVNVELLYCCNCNYSIHNPGTAKLLFCI